jgi:hypothetical protein
LAPAPIPPQELEDKIWKRIKENTITTAVLQQKVNRIEQFCEDHNEGS